MSDVRNQERNLTQVKSFKPGILPLRFQISEIGWPRQLLQHTAKAYSPIQNTEHSTRLADSGHQQGNSISTIKSWGLSSGCPASERTAGPRDGKPAPLLLGASQEDSSWPRWQVGALVRRICAFAPQRTLSVG